MSPTYSWSALNTAAYAKQTLFSLNGNFAALHKGSDRLMCGRAFLC